MHRRPRPPVLAALRFPEHAESAVGRRDPPRRAVSHLRLGLTLISRCSVDSLTQKRTCCASDKKHDNGTFESSCATRKPRWTMKDSTEHTWLDSSAGHRKPEETGLCEIKPRMHPNG